ADIEGGLVLDTEPPDAVNVGAGLADENRERLLGTEGAIIRRETSRNGGKRIVVESGPLVIRGANDAVVIARTAVIGGKGVGDAIGRNELEDQVLIESMADVQGDDHFADGGRKIGDDDNRISLARVGNGDGRIVIKAEREREQARRELEPVGDSILIGLYQESEIDGSATDKQGRGTDPEAGGVGAG